MSRKSKARLRALAAKLSKRPRGAGNVLHHQTQPRAKSANIDEKSHILEHLYKAAAELFEQRPEARVFTADVNSYEHVDVRVPPSGEVAMLPTISVRLVESTPAHWWFDGAIAFIDGELYDGRTPVRLEMLDTDDGRRRVEQIVREHIRARQPWFADRLVHFAIKSGRQNGNNLVVQVALALVDRQELGFLELMLALEKAHGVASIGMGKGAPNEDLTIPPKRKAIGAAREFLARATAAAETKRQKETAERARGYERIWSLWEESLDRSDARRPAALPADHPAVQAAIARSRALGGAHGTSMPDHRPRTTRTQPDMRNLRATSRAYLAMFLQVNGTAFADTTWSLSHEQDHIPVRIGMEEPITAESILDDFHREITPLQIETSTTGGRSWNHHANETWQWDWIETVRLASSFAKDGVVCRVLTGRGHHELIRYEPQTAVRRG